MSSIPPGQRMFPEGLKACQSHLLNHSSPSKVFHCNQFLSFEMSPDFFLYFLKRNKRQKASTHTHVLQESWHFLLWATYRDPKDLLRGIINRNLFQWKLFLFISLQKQKKIIGPGDPWGFKRARWWMKLEGVDTRSEMVNIQKFLQRSSGSSPLIPPFLFDLPWYHGCKLSTKLPWH